MINEQLHNYRIISLLGEGGMAMVYLAHDTKFDTEVAIKILRKEFVHNENIRKRFLAEAKNMFKMSHPNIIKVTDLIDAGDIVAFVMEYVDGWTLDAYVKEKGRLSDEEIERYFSKMQKAIEYVHEKGFIHRDIKPSNFIVSKEGELKLLDFGIAKNTNSDNDYTSTRLGQQMGTPLYMSPEQIECVAPITKQTDVYSLGVTLWFMVIGHSPYNLKDISILTLQNKIHQEPLPLTNTKWDGIIQNATKKNPEERTFHNEFKTRTALRVEKASHNSFLNIRNISIAAGILILVLTTVLILNNSKGKDELYQSVSPVTNDSITEIAIPSENQQKTKIDNIDSDDAQPEQTSSSPENSNNSRAENEKTYKPQEEENTEIEVTKLRIGQKYQGGIIFYLEHSGTHGLIADERDLGQFRWDVAIDACSNLKKNGYSDWYLPSEIQLQQLYDCRFLVGGFNQGTYWSSTVYNNDMARIGYFRDGVRSNSYKTNVNNVRAIRAF